MAEAGAGIGGSDGVEARPNRVDQRINGPGTDPAEMGLEAAKDQFNRIEVRRIGGEKPELTARRLNRLPCFGPLVHAQIVQDHHLPWSQGRDEVVTDPLGKEVSIQRSFKGDGRADPARAQGGQTGDIGSVIARDRGDQSLALGRPAMRAGQGGLGAGFVQKNQIVRRERWLLGLPAFACGGTPLGGDQTLFLRGRSIRWIARTMVPCPITRSWVVASQTRSSSIVASGTASIWSRSRRS